MKVYTISVRSLVEFILSSGDIESGTLGGGNLTARGLLGTRLHQKLQKKEKGDYQKEVPFEKVIPVWSGQSLAEDETASEARDFDTSVLKIQGRADGLFIMSQERFLEEMAAEELLLDPEMDAIYPYLMTGSLRTVDEIKSTAMTLEKIDSTTYPLHFAQAACYGYLLAEEENLPAVLVRITYIHIETEAIRHLYRVYPREELKAFWTEMTGQYLQWIRWKESWDRERTELLKGLTFPFPTYRPGQPEMMQGIREAIQRKGNLYIQAPTGIGKTISAWKPALEALGQEKVEKIFYLTAKNVTGEVALEGLHRILETSGSRLKILRMSAKDTSCLLEKRSCRAKDCPYARGHFDRVNEAVLASLQEIDEFSLPVIREQAKKYQVCPHELALDIASWCDVIISDMNYAFDPSAKLKRFFQTGEREPYVLLIDEAHNLVERGRSMFTAELNEADLKRVQKALPKTPGMKRAGTKIKKLLSQGADEVSFLEEEMPTFGDPGWTMALEDLQEALTGALELLAKEENQDLDEPSLDSYFNLIFFLRMWDVYTEEKDSYELLLSAYGKNLVLKLLCVDPSKLLRKVTENVTSAVFFSATLEPIAYFTSLLGADVSGKDRVLELTSPFDPKKRLLLTAPVPMTYRQRERSIPLVADLIAMTYQGKEGHYLAFFPSFQYLLQVQQELQRRYPAIRLAIQESGMTLAARNSWLEDFRTNKGATLGLCVLGGVFSEGINLTEEELIGAIIVSAGLPQISMERDLIKKHFNEISAPYAPENSWGEDFSGGFDGGFADGFAVAYTYPGMNRVLQAAGRVIRTEKDRGVVLLIDERFETSSYQQLFPADYQDRLAVTIETLPYILQDFWDRQEP